MKDQVQGKEESYESNEQVSTPEGASNSAPNEQKEGMDISQLIEDITLAKDTAQALQEGLSPAFQYAIDTLRSLQGNQNIITWEELTDIVGSEWVEILKEGGVNALGITAIKKALAAAEIYRENKQLIDALISAGPGIVDDVWDAAIDSLRAADDDGDLTAGEVGDVALQALYDIAVKAANDPAISAAIIPVLEEKTGIDFSSNLSVASALANRFIHYLMEKGEKQSSPGDEFFLSTLSLLLGQERWDELLSWLDLAAPNIQAYALFGATITGQIGGMLGNFLFSAADVAAGMGIESLIKIKRAFGLDTSGLQETLKTVEAFSSTAGVIQEIDGHVWHIYMLGPLALALADNPNNPTGTAVRFASVRYVPPAIRDGIRGAVGSWNALANVVMAAPALFKSFHDVERSLLDRENRITPYLVDAINNWAPIIGKKMAVALTTAFIRVLLSALIPLAGKVANLISSVTEAFQGPREPKLPEKDESSSALNPTQLETLAQPNRAAIGVRKVPQGVEEWYPGRGLGPYSDTYDDE